MWRRRLEAIPLNPLPKVDSRELWRLRDQKDFLIRLRIIVYRLGFELACVYPRWAAGALSNPEGTAAPMAIAVLSQPGILEAVQRAGDGAVPLTDHELSQAVRAVLPGFAKE